MSPVPEKFQAYGEAVCAFLSHATRREKAAVRQELMDHLTDHTQALLDAGCPPEAAETRALAAMGEAKEVGQALDQTFPRRWLVLSRVNLVLAILVGFAIGHSLHLEQWTSKFFHKLVRTLHLGGGPVLLQRLRLVQHPDRGHHRRSLTADVQSRAGRLHGHDLCLHAGAAICAIPLPQVVILLLVFGVGKLLAGVLTPPCLRTCPPAAAF